jgi:RNA polymerase sigma-70 factor (ECF subfamily)
MSEPSFNTIRLQDLLARMKAGDPESRNELVRASQNRLETLARRMLRNFPKVGRWADTDDVFQGAIMRLLRALQAVEVTNTRQFLGLAATMIRRELLDLARHFQGPQGIGANHDSVSPGSGSGPGIVAVAPQEAPDQLERWASLHTAVEDLPVELRETFGLRFYHHWTEAEIAALFEVDERTVRRRWRAACEALSAALGGKLPDAS